MTEYRTIYDGYCTWLQYKAIEITGFWIFKRPKVVWKYIRTDRYDYFDEQWEEWERRYGISTGIRDYNRYINSYNTDLNQFVKKHKVIDLYFIQRARVVQEKRRIAHDYYKQKAVRIGEIRGFH